MLDMRDKRFFSIQTAFIETCLFCFRSQLEEMMRCPDCYYMSNARPKSWFCKPCVSITPVSGLGFHIHRVIN